MATIYWQMRFQKTEGAPSPECTGQMRRTIIAIITLLYLATPVTAQRALSDQEIAQAIIHECLAIYHAERPCACPEDTARNGSRCGGRSAYNRPDGAAPRCYVKDVRPD